MPRAESPATPALLQKQCEFQSMPLSKWAAELAVTIHHASRWLGAHATANAKPWLRDSQRFGS